MIDLAYNPPPLVWPLVFVLVALLILRQIREDVRPITRGVVGSLAQHSAKYAMGYAMAVMYGAAASLQALGEAATALHWTYVAVAAKVLQPGIVAVLAYVNKSPSFAAAENAPEKPAAASNGTTLS